MKQKSRNKKPAANITNSVVSLYLMIMLGIFPLYYKYQYADMGNTKYKIFLYSSVICVVVFFLCSIFKKIFLSKDAKNTINKQNIKTIIRSNITTLDAAVILYFVCTTISFLCSSFIEKGFWGSDGWNMGYLSQFLFITIYFLIANGWNYQKWAIRLLLASSAIVFLVAVFHRFDVDILNIYGELAVKYKVLFLSTMGQSSWYSSFLCTVFPVGLYLFFISENKKVRRAAGVYSVISMCSLVTQNTDSAFMALFAVIMVLFYLSYENKKKQFLETIILVFGSFCFMGICQRIFTDKVIPLDTMSLFMSQSVIVWIMLVAAIGGYFVVCYYENKKIAEVKKQLTSNRKSMADRNGAVSEEKTVNRVAFWLLLGTIGAGVIGTIIFIVLNTNGFLLERFSYQSTNNYLLFDTQWGNGRGFSWQFAVASFAEFPFFRKLIGVGPDCFSAYVASVPEYLEQMKVFWGDLVLTNAHNEYLTKMYNLGIIGLLSYVGMLGTAVWTFLKYRKENPFLPAFALCTVSYMVHNIFCYEQVCCTPFFYILLGIGSSLIHNKMQKGTY